MDNRSYINAVSEDELVQGGDISARANIVSASSGSSGVPFYWPRGNREHNDAAQIYSHIYDKIYQASDKSTLLVVSFSMGSWIAGTYTSFGAIQAAMENNLRLVVGTPSIDQEEVLNVIQHMADYFDQGIIAGYPPFVRDILLEGKNRGVHWHKYKLGLSFAGEMISEPWRTNTMEIAGMDKAHRAINIYGTADMGIVGHETPLIRRAVNYKRNL